METETPAIGRELCDRLSSSLVALRGFDWEAVPLQRVAASVAADVWDAGEARRLMAEALDAVDAVHASVGAGDDVAGAAFLLRCAIAQALGVLSEVPSNALRLIELVSAAEVGLSQLHALVAARTRTSGSVTGPSELARALRNRQALADLRRIVSPASSSVDPCDVRARRAGNAISKALGASGATLLPIAPRMHLRDMRLRLNALLAERESEERNTGLERMLVDCASAVDILTQDVNVQLRDHDNALIETVRGAVFSGDLVLAARYLKSLEGLSAELDALASMQPLPGELVLDALEELWTSPEGLRANAFEAFGGSWLPPHPR